MSVPSDYIDPLYIGTFASPETPVIDLSARYVFVSFARRVSFDQALPIQVVPEPSTAWLIAVGVGLGAIRCPRRERRSVR